MRAGRMDRLITIKAKMKTTNDFGEEIIVYSTLASNVWAERLELRGSERWNAQQIVPEITCKYRIRYRNDINAQCIVVDEAGREYDIQPPLEIGRRQGLELFCSVRSDN
jgi:SPP1 family predicted phage head-tail adaptor